MSSSVCYITMLCSSDTNSSFNSLTDTGEIVAIVIGSLLGLAFFICIIVTIYFIFHKRKPQVQVWAHPCPTSQTYGQSMAMFPYRNYPQGSMQPSATDPPRIIEEPPPAYEEIDVPEDRNKKH